MHARSRRHVLRRPDVSESDSRGFRSICTVHKHVRHIMTATPDDRSERKLFARLIRKRNSTRDIRHHRRRHCRCTGCKAQGMKHDGYLSERKRTRGYLLGEAPIRSAVTGIWPYHVTVFLCEPSPRVSGNTSLLSRRSVSRRSSVRSRLRSARHGAARCNGVDGVT
jgi:hypothetical protein